MSEQTYYRIRARSDGNTFGNFDTPEEGWAYIDSREELFASRYYVIEVVETEAVKPEPREFYAVEDVFTGVIYGTRASMNREQAEEKIAEEKRSENFDYRSLRVVKVTVEPC